MCNKSYGGSVAADKGVSESSSQIREKVGQRGLTLELLVPVKRIKFSLRHATKAV
jgi:hypothetical protein